MTREELQTKASQWLTDNEGQSLDFDGVYGPQCVDEVQFYNRDVVGGPFLYGASAKDIAQTYPTDFYTWTDNSPTNFPSLGDIVIWGTLVGPDGHIAVCRDGNPNSFVSLDQNWNYVGSCQFITHSYNGVLGWLTPITQEPPAPAQPAPDPVVTPTPTEIPVTVTTTADSPVANVSTPTPESATTPSTTQEPTPVAKPIAPHNPVKSSLTIGDSIVFTLLKTKSVLIKLWNGIVHTITKKTK